MLHVAHRYPEDSCLVFCVWCPKLCEPAKFQLVICIAVYSVWDITSIGDDWAPNENGFLGYCVQFLRLTVDWPRRLHTICGQSPFNLVGLYGMRGQSLLNLRSIFGQSCTKCVQSRIDQKLSRFEQGLNGNWSPSAQNCAWLSAPAAVSTRLRVVHFQMNYGLKLYIYIALPWDVKCNRRQFGRICTQYKIEEVFTRLWWRLQRGGAYVGRDWAGLNVDWEHQTQPMRAQSLVNLPQSRPIFGQSLLNLHPISSQSCPICVSARREDANFMQRWLSTHWKVPLTGLPRRLCVQFHLFLHCSAPSQKKKLNQPRNGTNYHIYLKKQFSRFNYLISS